MTRTNIMFVKGQVLNTNETLQLDQCLQNGIFTLALQGDGNLCLYGAGEFIWQTGTNDRDVRTGTMQEDGNFCLRNRIS